MVEILIGADPEVFVRKNLAFVSGHGLIAGTKEHPFPVMDGAVQVDGMALEFNIAPAHNSKEFIDNINSVLHQLMGMVPDYEIALEAVADFDPEYMKLQPEEAVRLGCDPDYSAYTLQANCPPDGNRPFRTAAGHIHVGFGDFKDNYREDNHMADCGMLAQQMDLLLGVPSVLFDTCTKRRELYGKAGAFRPKPYGMEYRVLSNKWLQSKYLMEFVYNNSVRAVTDLMNGKFWAEEITDAQEVINNSDKKRAQVIMDRLGIALEV